MAQAERTEPQNVELHIERQRALGEKMIGDHDRPRWPELAFTAVGLAAIVATLFYNSYYPFN